MKIKTPLGTDGSDDIIWIGKKMLFDSAEENQKIAKDYYDKEDYRNAIESYSECRLALRLMKNYNLAVEPTAIIEKSEFINRVDKAINLLTDSGLISGEELSQERTTILESYVD